MRAIVCKNEMQTECSTPNFRFRNVFSVALFIAPFRKIISSCESDMHIDSYSCYGVQLLLFFLFFFFFFFFLSVCSTMARARCQGPCRKRPGKRTQCRICDKMVGPCCTHHTCAARPNQPNCLCNICIICAGPSLPLPLPADEQPEQEPDAQPEPEPE